MRSLSVDSHISSGPVLYHIRFVTYVLVEYESNDNGHLETKDPFQDLHLYHGVSVSDDENESV